MIVCFFYGCKDEADKDIYKDYPDADNSKSNDDEEGCGIIPDKNTETPDKSEVPDEIVKDAEETVDDSDTVPDETSEKENNTEAENEVNDNDDVEIADDPEIEDGPCPKNMVENGTWCIDKYEASKKDATAVFQGLDESIAVSKQGVRPWMVNPMNAAHYEKFKGACEAAGKRLCKDSEWIFSCEGTEESIYSWGNIYNREICNSVDAYCDEHCEANSISPESCFISENCGYTYDCFKVAITGEFLNCKNHSGAFDINGNVWEITDTGNSYNTRGGAFNCASPTPRLKCRFNAGWTDLYAGFRCCVDKKSNP